LAKEHEELALARSSEIKELELYKKESLMLRSELEKFNQSIDLLAVNLAEKQ